METMIFGKCGDFAKMPCVKPKCHDVAFLQEFFGFN